MNGKEHPQTSFWKGLSTLDWVAMVVCAVGLAALWGGDLLKGLTGLGLLQVVGWIAAFYVVYRVWNHWRSQVLWSLRNRLIVAYLFIAVVPVFLLLILALIAGQILYSQFAAYLLNHEIHDRIEALEDSSASLAAAETSLPASINEAVLDKSLAAQVDIAQGKRLPNLKVEFGVSPEYFHAVAGL